MNVGANGVWPVKRRFNGCDGLICILVIFVLRRRRFRSSLRKWRRGEPSDLSAEARRAKVEAWPKGGWGLWRIPLDSAQITARSFIFSEQRN